MNSELCLLWAWKQRFRINLRKYFWVYFLFFKVDMLKHLKDSNIEMSHFYWYFLLLRKSVLLKQLRQAWYLLEKDLGGSKKLHTTKPQHDISKLNCFILSVNVSSFKDFFVFILMKVKMTEKDRFVDSFTYTDS